MNATLRMLEVDMRLSGVFLRLSLSRDANPDPCYHRVFIDAGARIELRWKSATPTADAMLIWEACVMERSPADEGGDSEPVIAGGAVTPARGRHRVVLRDFYSDSGEVLGILLVEIEGLGDVPAIAAPAVAPEAADVARLQWKYESYYSVIAIASRAGDVRMRVPRFRFYGGEVQASYLALMTADMDSRFAHGVLRIVLEEAGMSEDEFVDIGRRQLKSQTYLRETDALVARLGEFATFTANLLRYRSDLSAPFAERRKLIEKIVPHVREERGGDCEDLALEIYFCWRALQRIDARAKVVGIASTFALQYQPFVVSAVATAAAAGGNASGEMLHVFTVAIPLIDACARMPAHYAFPAFAFPWVGDLPVLAPLEGTNWCDALHLPQDRFYGSVAADARELRETERREKLARDLSPALRGCPTRIRQRLDATLSEEGFSGFYRRVTEAWSDFSDRGSCCFSVRRASTGRFGVSLGEIASKGDYEFAVVFEHSPSELASVRRAMRTVAPVPAWRGRIKKASREGLPRTVEVRPRRASRLHADAIVYRFRSRKLATSTETRAAFAALAERFDLDCRAWKLPPDGAIEYIAVYAREKRS